MGIIEDDLPIAYLSTAEFPCLTCIWDLDLESFNLDLWRG